MKKGEKIGIAILIIIAVVIIAVIMISRNGGKDNKETQNIQNTQGEEFVRKEADGTRVNTSSKLAEAKKCGNLEISNIELKEKNGESYIQATVKNAGSTTEEGTFLKLKIVDKAGSTITEVKGYVDTVKAGETYLLKIKTSADFANAYDFTVSK